MSDQLSLIITYNAGNNEKARKAAKAVKKSQWKKSLKPRYSVVFHRPATLKRTRNAKVPRTRYVYYILNSLVYVDDQG